MFLARKLNLIDGFKRFRQKYFVMEKDLYQTFSAVGQSPKLLLIACSDSRVDPAILFSTEPGDMFVIRNVANLVPPYEEGGGYHGTSAGIEFAVNQLKVESVVILGHAQCGGIAALARGEVGNDSNVFVNKWVTIADEARAKVLKTHSLDNFREFCHACEQESILTSLRNLKTFPFIQKKIDDGSLTVSGWYFDLEKGKLWEYSDKTSKFMEL